MWYLYVLKCADGSLYTGVTNNIEKRMGDHKNGVGSKYVRSRLPFELLYQEEFESKQEAMKREFAVKKLSRKQKLELLHARRKN
jgi:putative endonuclease